jgi:hypothetical protein
MIQVPAHPPRLEAPAPKTPAQASLVKVRSFIQTVDGVGNRGSGVVVAPGIVATNAHVVGPGQHVEVAVAGRWYRARLRNLRPEWDLALLDVAGLPAPPVALSTTLPVEGQRLFDWGFPHGGDLQSTSAQVAMLWSYLDAELIHLHMQSIPGLSGSGLFNANAELTGLVTFGLNLPPGTTMAIPVTWIHSLLKEGPTPPPADSKAVTMDKDFALRRLAVPSNTESWGRLTEQWTMSEPSNPEAWSALVEAELALLDDTSDPQTMLAKAARIARAAEQCVRLDPKRADSWTALGQTRDLLGQWPEAEQALLNVVALDPTRANAWESLGRVRFNLRKYDAAVEALKVATRLAPDASRAWALLARCEAQQNHSPEAQRYFRTAVAWRPFHAPWLLEWARSALQNGDSATAHSVLDRLESLGAEEASILKKALGKR